MRQSVFFLVYIKLGAILFSAISVNGLPRFFAPFKIGANH